MFLEISFEDDAISATEGFGGSGLFAHFFFFSPSLTTMSATNTSNFATPLEAIQGIILAPTEPFNLNSTTPVRGYDFGNGVDYEAIFKAFKTVGFQATNFGLAVDELNAMV